MYLYGHSDTVFLYNIGAGRVNATTITSDVMVVNTGSMNDTWVKSGKKILDVKITYMGNVFFTRTILKKLFITPPVVENCC